MNRDIQIPCVLKDVPAPTFGFINCEYALVRSFLTGIWKRLEENGWVKYCELPCIVDVERFGLYQGKWPIGIFAESLDHPDRTCFWSWQADGSHAVLNKL